MYQLKKCSKEDIKLVRDFFVKITRIFEGKVSWHIDRINFTYSMSRIMNGVSEEDYREAMRLVYKEDELIAVVLTEGEDRGEAFIETVDYNLEDELLNDIFNFIETDLMKKDDETSFVNLRLPREARKMINIAKTRGFIKTDHTETKSILDLDRDLDYPLADGYSYKASDSLSFESKAKGHARAFAYYEKEDMLINSALGLELLTKMLDYKAVYDIAVTDENDELAAFATMWFDEVNKLGILEPVGSHDKHRRKGLAKAAIYKACREIKKKGAKYVIVGSSQDFYKAIGFKELFHADIYTLRK